MTFPYQPTERRLSSLTNEELQSLYLLRASKIKIEPEFCDNNKEISWRWVRPLMALYEVMLEIQSRYPSNEIMKYYGDPEKGIKGAYDLLPLPKVY